MPITKTEMVDVLYNETDLPKKSCLNIVDSFFEIIKAELEKGNPVMVSGFGKWTVRAKRGRKGRNPQTGEDMNIEARKVVTFKSSPVLTKSMNS